MAAFEHDPVKLAPGLVHQVNARIREVAAAFGPEYAQLPVEFVCECGCLTPVPLTVVMHDSGKGVWAPGHRP